MKLNQKEMNNFTFKRNWCDYLTPCPYSEGIMIGEHECVSNCPYCKGYKEEEGPLVPSTDYSKYFIEWSGEVQCSYPKY